MRRMIFVAHRLEAEVFIDTYGLRKRGAAGPAVFEGEVNNQQTVLVLVGQGVLQAEETIRRFLLTVPPLKGDRWMNFGIAGSGEYAPGTLVVADGLIDRDAFCRSNDHLIDS